MGTEQTLNTQKESGKGYAAQILLIGAFFFIFGFITWVNGALILYFKIACELESWQAFLVTFAFYISYTVMAIPSSKILARTGTINGMRVGLVVMAAGCLLFLPAAMIRSYPVFLTGLFVIGTGTTLLQTAVNPYITLIGPASNAAQRMSIMGLCNKFAGVIAPVIMAAIILSNPDSLIKELAAMSEVARAIRLDELAREVIMPYSVLTVILLIIAYILKFAHLPEIISVDPLNSADRSGTGTAQDNTKKFVLGFIAIFCTVGLEVVAGDTISIYGQYHNMPLGIAKNLTSYTLACTMIGYLFGALAIPKLISQERAFLISSLVGLVIVTLIITVPGVTSVYLLAAMGLSNALLWPAIWPQALRGLTGKALNTGSAILIMGILGGAVMPPIYGKVAQLSNSQVAYWLLIPCYLFMIYYYFIGKKEVAAEVSLAKVAAFEAGV